ncbi:S8/S53 family peptidase [Paraburkholderia dilworthii]|uniref:S8/S53 family peptidase n=1 Tax=Paraburkholderia dilworthii TaxID=948106 RepID=A0ABW9DIA2_9BURK
MIGKHASKLLIRLPGVRVTAFRGKPTPSVGIIAIGPGKVEPLFPETTLQFVGQATDWVLLEPDTVEDIHPWDRAHQQVGFIRTNTPDLSGKDVYVEPNTPHQRRLVYSTSVPNGGQTVQEAEPPGPPYPPYGTLNPHYPPSSKATLSPDWHLAHGRFHEAWKVTRGAGVRIAHLDIGWWPCHYSAPLHMLTNLGKNFVEGGDNTVDPGKGPNAGHGTATLALLAGKTVELTSKTASTPNGQVYKGFIGGAPEAEIVPVRVAGVDGSVVYLYGDTMARGLAHALDPGDGKRCDVVSLSHGGLPMKSWAHATNALYEAGVVVVAAAGDSFWAVFTDIATHFTVYPSAFYRVVTSTGVTSDGGPYKRDELSVMQGCWGPDKVMMKATGSYTPNVPWMRYKTKYGWNMDGAGTSASTPQTAAACALWLAVYAKGYEKDWLRVAACREALKLSVSDPKKDFHEIGLGRLNAASMLDEKNAQEIEAMRAANKLQHIEPDDVSWPFFRLLFGLPPPGNGIEEMYEVEAYQIFYQSHDETLIASAQDCANGHHPSTGDVAALRVRFLKERNMSNALRNYLTSRP